MRCRTARMSGSSIPSMRPVAVFRFSPTEGPGHFGDWLDRHRIDWQLVALDAGDPVPRDARAFSGIGMMGGPMSVNDALPWIAPVGAVLRDAVARDVPVIGHCLGGQLLAQALGAPVTRAPVAEIGWIDVDVCNEAAGSEWFGGRNRFTSFQWHFDTFALPDRATRVLTNGYNANQAYTVNDRHIGFQCHVEMTRALVEAWCETGRDELPAATNGARQSEHELTRDLDRRIAALNVLASDVYARWVRGLQR